MGRQLSLRVFRTKCSGLEEYARRNSILVQDTEQVQTRETIRAFTEENCASVEHKSNIEDIIFSQYMVKWALKDLN